MLSSYAIPLSADTQTLHNKGKIHWAQVPPPTERTSNRRFSSLPLKAERCGEQALEGTVHYAAPFNLLQSRQHTPLGHSFSRAQIQSLNMASAKSEARLQSSFKILLHSAPRITISLILTVQAFNKSKFLLLVRYFSGRLHRGLVCGCVQVNAVP